MLREDREILLGFTYNLNGSFTLTDHFHHRRAKRPFRTSLACFCVPDQDLSYSPHPRCAAAPIQSVICCSCRIGFISVTRIAMLKPEQKYDRASPDYYQNRWLSGHPFRLLRFVHSGLRHSALFDVSLQQLCEIVTDSSTTLALVQSRLKINKPGFTLLAP